MCNETEFPFSSSYSLFLFRFSTQKSTTEKYFKYNIIYLEEM